MGKKARLGYGDRSGRYVRWRTLSRQGRCNLKPMVLKNTLSICMRMMSWAIHETLPYNGVETFNSIKLNELQACLQYCCNIWPTLPDWIYNRLSCQCVVQSLQLCWKRLPQETWRSQRAGAPWHSTTARSFLQISHTHNHLLVFRPNRWLLTESAF